MDIQPSASQLHAKLRRRSQHCCRRQRCDQRILCIQSRALGFRIRIPAKNDSVLNEVRLRCGLACQTDRNDVRDGHLHGGYGSDSLPRSNRSPELPHSVSRNVLEAANGHLIAFQFGVKFGLKGTCLWPAILEQMAVVEYVARDISTGVNVPKWSRPSRGLCLA